MKSKNKTLLSEFSLFAVAFIWGGGFVVVKQSLDSITPLWLLTARFFVGAAAIVLIFFKKLKLINRRSLLAGIVSGILIYGGFLFQTIAVLYTTASKNALLTASYVVLVPFVYWIMAGKRPAFLQVAAALLCFAGIAMLMYTGTFGGFNKGDLLTLLCGLLFAVQISFLGIYAQKHDTIVLTIVQLATCTVISFAASLLFDRNIPKTLPLDTTVSVLYLGLLSTALAYLVQTVAQKYTPPANASLILCLECVIGCVLSVILLNERFTPLMWAGSALTVISVLLSQRTRGEVAAKAILSE